MKHIDEHYKDWCGTSHTENSVKLVHDSAEAIDFAEYYHKEMQQINSPIESFDAEFANSIMNK